MIIYPHRESSLWQWIEISYKVQKHKTWFDFVDHLALIACSCPTRSGCKDKSVRLRRAYLKKWEALHKDSVWVGRSHHSMYNSQHWGLRYSSVTSFPSTMKKLALWSNDCWVWMWQWREVASIQVFGFNNLQRAIKLQDILLTKATHSCLYVCTESTKSWRIRYFDLWHFVPQRVLLVQYHCPSIWVQQPQQQRFFEKVWVHGLKA